jgi:hypothetical protein
MPDSGGLLFGGAGESGTETAGIWQVTCPGGDITRLWEFGGDPDPVNNGNSIVFAGISTQSIEAGIWTLGILLPELQRLAEEGERPRFSPNGEWVAYLYPTIVGASDLRMVSRLGGDYRTIADHIISHEWLDDNTLICLEAGEGQVNIVKVTTGLTPETSLLIQGGSQFGLDPNSDLIAFQNEENGQASGIHVTTSEGGGSKPIVASGAYPQFLPTENPPSATSIVFEDTGGIWMATSGGASTAPFGINP